MGYRKIARRFPGINLLLALTFIGCGGVARFDIPFTLYTSIASADLNGGGRLDIAMASSYLSGSPPHPGHAVVLLKNPAPAEGFSPPVRYGAGNDPDFLLVRDIAGDGKPDLVVAEATLSANAGGTGNISILLQDPGNPGGFLPAVVYPAGRSPKVAVGDIDGDGNPDLVVGTASDPAGISLFRQDPANPGAFESPVSVASLPGVSAIAVEDLDGDGRLDIAVAANAGILILIQDASGPRIFLPAVAYAAGSQPISIAAGDLNGDGRPDLAVANYGSPDGSIKGSASILLQAPTDPGKFLPATDYATGIRSRSIAIGDLNGDGNADIVVADEGAVMYYQDPVQQGIFSDPMRIGS